MNYGGHLDNALLLTRYGSAGALSSRSATANLTSTALASSFRCGAAVPLEAFHGEVMIVSMGAADFGSKGCDLLWCMNEKSTNREVARGKTGIVFFDYATRKIAQVPAGFRTRFEH
jgi:4-hydroxybenzoyl-CoA thioesterase